MDTFKLIDSEEKAYFLGFMYADGCIHHSDIGYSVSTRLKLASKDQELLIKLSKIFPTFSLAVYKQDVTLTSYNRELAANLESWGVLPQKSFSNKDNLKLPNIAKELRVHFIRGFWDGDGCIYQRNSNGLDICAVNTSKPLLDSMCRYLNSINIEAKVNGYTGSNSNLFRLRITKQKSCLVFKELIYSKATIYLERKYKKIINFNPESITIIKRRAMLANLAQKKSDELLETHSITKDEYLRAISSQAIVTTIEGSETT